MNNISVYFHIITYIFIKYTVWVSFNLTQIHGKLIVTKQWNIIIYFLFKHDVVVLILLLYNINIYCKWGFRIYVILHLRVQNISKIIKFYLLDIFP